MKIVVLEGYAVNPGDLSWEWLEAFGSCTVYPRLVCPEETIRRIGDADVVLINKTPITAEILDACPGVKLICVLATGYNVVDCAAAKARNVLVCNVPDYGTSAVAQYTFALLLELCHQIGHHDRAVHAGKWSSCPDFCFWDTPQMELMGKTLGIIGFGRIGQAVGRIAKAFGMEVLAYSRTEYPEGRQIGRYVTLEELLSKSDIISLHCPLTPETTGIINRNTIAMMKDGAIVINTSRGAAIVEEDLADDLRACAGAGPAQRQAAGRGGRCRQNRADSCRFSPAFRPQLHHHAPYGLGTEGKPPADHGLHKAQHRSLPRRFSHQHRQLKKTVLH